MEDTRDQNALLDVIRQSISEWRLADFASSEESYAAGRAVSAFELLDERLKSGEPLPVDWDVT